MKNVKKLVSVLLCVAMIFSLTVISFAGDQTTIEQAISDGNLIEFIIMLFSNVNWESIITILVQTVRTFLNIFGVSI